MTRGSFLAGRVSALVNKLVEDLRLGNVTASAKLAVLERLLVAILGTVGFEVGSY